MKFPRLLLALSVGLFATAAQAALKPGDSAPDFTVQAATGGKDFSFSLAEQLKKGPVVVYFYPNPSRAAAPSRRMNSPRTTTISSRPARR